MYRIFKLILPNPLGIHTKFTGLGKTKPTTYSCFENNDCYECPLFEDLCGVLRVIL